MGCISVVRSQASAREFAPCERVAPRVASEVKDPSASKDTSEIPMHIPSRFEIQ